MDNNYMAVTPSLGKEHNHALYATKPNTGKGVAQIQHCYTHEY